jgi:hypothetical protein
MNTFLKICFILILNLIPQLGLIAQSSDVTETRKVLFSTGNYEKPVINGSSIILSPIGNSVMVLTSDEAGRIYVYENGNRRGPYKDINDTKVSMPEDDPGEFDPVFRKESDAGFEKYLEYNNEGQVTIKFGGKSFGPFQFILEFYSAPDQSAFSAIVMKDSKPQIITSSGNKFDLDGQPGYNHISPSGKKMMVITVKENNEAGLNNNNDEPGLSTGTTGKFPKETEGSQPKPPEAFIWFQDGKKFGPFDPKKITENNPAFMKNGGDNWLLTMNSKLYINGIPVKDLANEYISPSNIWISPDGKRFGIIVYNRIEFSDGKVYKDPLKIRFSVDRNRVTIWWLLFENEKDIVLYSKII